MEFYSNEQNVFAYRQQEDVMVSYDFRKKILRNIIGKILKGQCRIVYMLHEYEEYSLSDISLIMGLPYETIKKYKQRANNCIKDIF